MNTTLPVGKIAEKAVCFWRFCHWAIFICMVLELYGL